MSVARLRRRTSQWLAPGLCLLPVTMLIMGVLGVPIAQTFINSFSALDRYGNRMGSAGWENYASVLADSGFRLSLWNTVIWTTAVVALTMLISLAAASALHRKFPLRSLARGILILPWASSLVISAMVWRYIFDGDFGPLNAMLLQAGIIKEPVYWLSQRSTSFPAMIWVAVFVSIPFTTTVLLAGLQGIPLEQYEAAKVDGATPWRSFVSVTLPNLREVIVIATVINVIYVFNSFPIVWTMTGGGPANTTDIAMTHLYKRAFSDKQFGPASAEAVLIFLLLLSFSALHIALVRRRERT